MSFATATPPLKQSAVADTPDCIQTADWPEICISQAREVLRIDGTVTDERLHESLQNASYAITNELRDWHQAQPDDAFVDERLQHLYRRAVYFYTQAELLERYRNLDVAKNGERHYASVEDAAGDARRTSRWAVSDILTKPRLTVWVL